MPTQSDIYNITLANEISKAIETHWQWKVRLHSAIDNGTSDFNSAEVAKDDACEFGQWLYGPTIPAVECFSADYISVRTIHANFHKCAAKVLECVAIGKKAQANALMNGEYAKVSADLTSAMLKWKEAAGG